MKNEYPFNDFGVIINNNAKEIVNFLNTKGYDTRGLEGNGKNDHFYYVEKGMTEVYYCPFFNVNPTSKFYILEQLQYLDYLSNQNKEIITYELLPQYEKFLPTLDKISSHFSNQFPPYKTGGTTSMYSLNFKEAGLLDIWFKPVYEIKEEKFEMNDWVTVISIDTYSYNHSCGVEKPIIGNTYQVTKSLMEGYITLSATNSNWEKISLKASDLRKATPEEIESATQETIHMAENFNLTIRNKRVYHISEDITAYVKAIGEWWNESLPKKLDKYFFQIDDITLGRTGCQTKTTSIKQWLEIYEKIK